MDVIELKALEHGLRVFEVVKHNTSRLCAFHGAEVRICPRGVINCLFWS